MRDTSSANISSSPLQYRNSEMFTILIGTALVVYVIISLMIDRALRFLAATAIAAAIFFVTG